jgi:hypothetical protein
MGLAYVGFINLVPKQLSPLQNQERWDHTGQPARELSLASRAPGLALENC